jgi:hypothetical protein
LREETTHVKETIVAIGAHQSCRQLGVDYVLRGVLNRESESARRTVVGTAHYNEWGEWDNAIQPIVYDFDALGDVLQLGLNALKGGLNLLNRRGI